MNSTQIICTKLMCLTILPLLVVGILLMVMGSKKDDDISSGLFGEGVILLVGCASLVGLGFILIPAM